MKMQMRLWVGVGYLLSATGLALPATAQDIRAEREKAKPSVFTKLVPASQEEAVSVIHMRSILRALEI